MSHCSFLDVFCGLGGYSAGGEGGRGSNRMVSTLDNRSPEFAFLRPSIVYPPPWQVDHTPEAPRRCQRSGGCIPKVGGTHNGSAIGRSGGSGDGATSMRDVHKAGLEGVAQQSSESGTEKHDDTTDVG